MDLTPESPTPLSFTTFSCLREIRINEAFSSTKGWAKSYQPNKYAHTSGLVAGMSGGTLIVECPEEKWYMSVLGSGLVRMFEDIVKTLGATDTQKQILQHIHKLLEKPEDWKAIPSHTGNFDRIEHTSKLSVSWPTHPDSHGVLLRTPHLDEALPLEDESLRSSASNLRRRRLESTTLAFLESLQR